MADKPKKERSPGKFKVLVSAGINDEGLPLYVDKGEAEGTSKKNAVSKAVEDKTLSLNIGDVVVAVSSKQFVPKPISLSI